MKKLYQQIQEMRVTCGWDKTDTPERLAKYTVMEAAELLECFLDEEVDDEAVQSEVADVLMYVLALCMDKGWDYEDLIYEKIIKVEEKYGVHE
jgi:Protein containing tetrapyrrole methyltransferase domain and MazG-like (predicted pyrophosphatase) domain